MSRRNAVPLTARQTLNLYTAEDELDAAIVGLADATGWISFHDRDARQDEAGWFDRVLAKAGHPLILAELKRQRGRLSPQQRLWQRVVRQATGIYVAEWRPAGRAGNQ